MLNLLRDLLPDLFVPNVVKEDLRIGVTKQVFKTAWSDCWESYLFRLERNNHALVTVSILNSNYQVKAYLKASTKTEGSVKCLASFIRTTKREGHINLD